MRMPIRSLLFRLVSPVPCLLVLASLAPAALAVPPAEARKLLEKVSPSVVLVQYTVEGEFGRTEWTGQGVVISEDGQVMTSITLFPVQVPNAQMKQFKIIIPGDEEKELAAEFLGRDERSEVAFLKTTEPQKWPAIEFEAAPLGVADQIISIGRLPKEAGYQPYYLESAVSAVLRGPTPHVLVNPNGLTSVGSPVFTAAGKAIGFVPYQADQPVQLANVNKSLTAILSNPPRFFVPASDFLPSLKDPPSGEPLRIPWLGVQLAPVNKEVAEFYNLKNVPVAQVGEVIPDSPGAKAGLKTGDKITRMNGEALERGDEPAETPAILYRQVRRMQVGQEVKLTVIRERDKPPIEVTLTLEQQPRQPNVAERFWAEDVGLAVREVVWVDTYAKKLPATTPGVVVAFLRPSSSAATAGLRVGDFVTEINKQPITDLKMFEQTYKEFRQANPQTLIILEVKRDDKTNVIKIEPPQ